MATLQYDPIGGGTGWSIGSYTDVDDGTRFPATTPDDGNAIYAEEDSGDTGWNTFVFTNIGGGGIQYAVTSAKIFYRPSGPDDYASGEITIGGQSLGYGAFSPNTNWNIATVPLTGYFSGEINARIYPGFGNHDEGGMKSLYVEFEAEKEVVNRAFNPPDPGVCAEYLIPDKNRPSYINSSGNIAESSVPYSGGFDIRNSEDTSFYNASGDLSFAYYICSGRNQDDSTYLVPTGTTPQVYYFMWQGDPLHIKPTSATLWINASGLVTPPYEVPYFGNYYDPNGDFGLEVRVVGPTGDYRVITDVSRPLATGVLFPNYSVGTDFTYAWGDVNADYDEGFNIPLSTGAVAEAHELDLFYGNRTEIRGYFSVNTYGDDRFALSEMLILFEGECLDRNGLCALHTVNRESANNNTNLYLATVEQQTSGIPLFLGSIAEDSGNTTLFIPAKYSYYESGNLFLKAPEVLDTIYNNTNLYTTATTYLNTNLESPTLYVKNSVDYNEGVSLFISGGNYATYSGYRQLHIEGTQFPSGSIPLYTAGPTVSSGITPLYITSFIDSSSNVNLYLDVAGEGTERIARPLFVYNAAPTTGGIPLKIGSTEWSGGRELFIQSRDFIPTGIKDMDMFIWSSLNDGARAQTNLYTTNKPDAEFPLYIKTNETASIYDYMNLHIDGELANLVKYSTELCMLGNPVAYSSAPLFMPDLEKIDHTGSVNLFINRSINSAAYNSPIYLHAAQPVTTGNYLYISGAIKQTENNTLYVAGQGLPAASNDLYIHGF